MQGMATKSRVKHKNPITGSLNSPYRETGMSSFGYYLWWAFCFMEKINVLMLNNIVISSTRSFMDKYPVLLKILARSKKGFNDWDFYMTVAMVGIYFMSNKVGKEEAENIYNQLQQLDKQMPEALNNFFDFLDKKDAKHTNLSQLTAIIGVWVLWNIVGDTPSLEECRELAPAIGSYLSKALNSYLIDIK